MFLCFLCLWDQSNNFTYLLSSHRRKTGWSAWPLGSSQQPIEELQWKMKIDCKDEKRGRERNQLNIESPKAYSPFEFARGTLPVDCQGLMTRDYLDIFEFRKDTPSSFRMFQAKVGMLTSWGRLVQLRFEEVKAAPTSQGPRVKMLKTSVSQGRTGAFGWRLPKTR